MKHTLTSKAAELMRKNGKHRRWRRAFSGMAAVVVFITTYMLILPAITMENKAICGMAEHTHTDACYEMQLVCTQEETPEGADVHVHGPECYEQQQVLTCTKQEGEGHTHTDACYGYVCGQEESAGHTHTDACYTEVTHRELTCTEPESAGHTHGDGCYDADGNLVCTEAESTGHTHGDSCYTETVTRELTCGQEESAGHTHTDVCIGLICGKEEYEGHTHTDACYTTEDVLVCTQPTGHTHGDGCYEKVLVCDVPEHTHTEECYPAAEPEEPQEPELICTLPEHNHEDACYDADGNLICGMEEHTHTEECYAPVEIPEEETPTTAFPEEIPEGYVEYTFDNEAGLTVTAYAPEGAFGQDVQLFAEVLSEDSEEYAQAKENLDKAENAPEYTGMAAMDIRFVDAAAEDPAQAEEIEPDAEMGQVFVKIDAQALLPEDVDESTLAVQHHAKVSDGGIFGTGIFEHTDVVVETVADNTEETGDITAVPDETALPETLPALADEPETEEAATLEEPAAETETEETQPAAMNVEAEFAVNSFSTFTITWDVSYGKTKTANLIYGYIQNGQFVKFAQQPSRDISLDDKDNINVLAQGSPITENGKVYQLSTARYATVNGPSIVLLSYNSGYDETWQRIGWAYTQENSAGWTNTYNTANSVDIYMIYVPDASGLEDTVDTIEKGITIDVFDYDSDSINAGKSLNFLYNTNNIDWGSTPWNKWTGVSGGAPGGVYQGIVQNKLEDGYPKLSTNINADESLKYLFTSGYGNTAYQNANYLFMLDNQGYYHYNSAENFAKLNTTPENDGDETFYRFSVYNEPIDNGDAPSNPKFLPFNDITDRSGYNYHFGMKVSSKFIMPKDGLVSGNDMVFEFEGDDDVWVFVDGALILDMGGIHDNYKGSINFATGEININYKNKDNTQASAEAYNTTLKALMTEALGEKWVKDNMVTVDGHTIFMDYSEHTLDFFYLERGASGSNCKIRFNLQTVPSNSLLVGKELVPGTPSGDNDEITDYLKDTLSYTFKVLKVENGQVTDKSFLAEGTRYTIRKNGQDTGRTGSVDANGEFTLKADEIAVFGEAFKANSGSYVVREIMDSDYTGQYDGVGFTVAGAGGTTAERPAKEEEEITSGFTHYQTDTISAKNTSTTVIFKNKVDYSELSLLKVTKVVAPGSAIDEDKQFPIIIKLDGESIAGAKYTITDAQGETGALQTVGPDGIINIKANETINITQGILVGTKYEVFEKDDENAYNILYGGMVSWNDGSKELNFTDPNKASGEFEYTNSVVNVFVRNADYDVSASFVLDKVLIGAENGEQHTFNFQIEQVNADGSSFKPQKFLPGASVVTNGESENHGELVIGYKSDEITGNPTYYYKVTEIAGDGSDGISYDTNYYIIKIEITGISDEGWLVYNDTVTWYNQAGEVIERDAPDTRAISAPLLFINSKTGDLSITKRVEYNGSDTYESKSVFAFEVKLNGSDYTGTPTVTYTKDGSGLTWEAVKDYTGWPEGTNQLPSTLNFSGGNATVYVPAGATIKIEGLPAAATAQITETTTDGYAVSWEGGTATSNGTKTATVTTAQISTNPAVTCTNTTGAVLPSTGGMGTTPFLALGTLLTLGAGMLLVQRRRKEGSDAV